MPKIFVIDDDPDIRDTVKKILTANGFLVDSYQTMNDFMESLGNTTDLPDHHQYGRFSAPRFV